MIDCGDHVKHIPTGEEWLVAVVSDNRLYWCGYPFGGSADLADCVLIKKATPEKRLALLKELAEKHGNETPILVAREQYRKETNI